MKDGQEGWKVFFGSKKSVLLLLVLAMISSVLYVIYLEQTNQLPNEYLEKYLERVDLRWSLDSFLVIFFTYFKRYLLVWLFGLVPAMIPISILLTYIYIFSYGFSMSWLYITLGIKGMAQASLLFGIQGVMMIGCLLFLVDRILSKVHIFEEEALSKYSFLLLIGCIGCGVVTSLEMFLNI